jgi:NADP-dependent 3-hydroxy acid dehydrogenase YdfG
VDILISNAGPGAEGCVRDLDMAAYEDAVGSVFLGFVRLIVELRRAQALPAKIINVLTADVLAGRSGRSCGAAGQAALWAFTRSLRRTCGNETQVVEAVLAFAGTARAAESGRQRDGRSEADGARPDAAGIAAARIREAERHGRERIAISGNRVHSRSARRTVTGFQMGCSDA